MREYVVELEAVVPSLATASVEEQERRADTLLDTLEAMAEEGAYGIEVPAAFGGLGGRLGGRFYVKAAEANTALELGMSALREALSKVGCPEFAWLRVMAEPFEGQDDDSGDEREDGNEESLEAESAHELPIPGAR